MVLVKPGERLTRLKVDSPSERKDVMEDLADAMPGG
jgi:hypothetical protein